MELNEFIENALTQIIDGVNAAAKHAKDNGAIIDPANDKGMTFDNAATTGRKIAEVNFDVALSVSEGTGTKAGISVLRGAINLSAGGQSTAENSVVSRIRFVVPMALPKHD